MKKKDFLEEVKTLINSFPEIVNKEKLLSEIEALQIYERVTNKQCCAVMKKLKESLHNPTINIQQEYFSKIETICNTKK